MFIQLTRTDGVPVWLNACFVVTIEPARGGGSIVVPIGDGLDYEVREPPEKVLSMLEGAPSPKVVPVPPPKALVPRPDDVSPEPEPSAEGVERTADPGRQKKAGRAKKAPVKKAPVSVPVEGPADRQQEDRVDGAQDPAPKAKRTARKKSADSGLTASTMPDGFEKIVEDLKSRKCRTVKRIHNAIKSFHGKTDSGEIDAIIGAMAARGYILVESDGRVNWPTQVI